MTPKEPTEAMAMTAESLIRSLKGIDPKALILLRTDDDIGGAAAFVPARTVREVSVVQIHRTANLLFEEQENGVGAIVIQCTG